MYKELADHTHVIDESAHEHHDATLFDSCGELLPVQEEKEQHFNIDRNQEDGEIERFQKTGDLRILEKVYEKRIPTLWTWIRMHYIPGVTCCSKQDLFSEFTIVFLNAAQKYKRSRGAFNTCLYTFLLNRIKNIKNSRYAKKRTPEFYKGPISDMLRSLDYTYDNKEGSEVTLKDLIPDSSVLSLASKINLEEALDILSQNNKTVKSFLRDLSEGNTLCNLLKKYKTRTGHIKISPVKKSLLVGRKNKVKKFIKDHGRLKGDFRLKHYCLQKNRLYYTVEMKKTKETKDILRAIRQIRCKKSEYLQKIVGENVI